MNGDPINCQWREGDFAGKAIDKSNPPRFESQASYLRRLGLLAPGEERRVKPAAFEPEIVSPEEENGEPDDVVRAAEPEWIQ